MRFLLKTKAGVGDDPAPAFQKKRRRRSIDDFTGFIKAGAPRLGIAFAAIGIFVSSCPVPRFALVRDLTLHSSDGRLLASIDLPDAAFGHHYVHSFHLTPVDELFRVEENGSLRLHELRYESLGVGMPTEVEEGFRLDNGRFILSIDRTFKKIPIMVSIVPGHGITVGERLYPFTDWFRPEDLVVLSGRVRTLLLPGGVLK